MPGTPAFDLLRSVRLRSLSRCARVVPLLAALLGGLPALATDRQFAEATTHYRNGRIAMAYGKFLELAERGDADAARIALFMHRYGPVLYGSYWDASAEDVAEWRRLADSGLGRTPPAYRPQLAARPATPRPRPEPALVGLKEPATARRGATP